MKKIKLSKDDIGRWIRVRFVDVGVRDLLVVGYEKVEKGETVQVFDPSDENLSRLNTDDIVSKGNRITVPAF